jgi:hypothetical protein
VGYQSTITARRIGFDPPSMSGVSGFALNAAARCIGFAFTAQAATSLSAFRFYVASGLVGTGGTLTCKLYADVANAPNLGGGALDTLTVGSLSGLAWVNATGGTYSLTRGTRYWAVIFNADGTPASNYCSIGYLSSLLGSEPTVNDQSAYSTNSGSTWSYGGCSARFSFADGNYLGIPVSGTTVLTGTGAVYGTLAAGTRFTLSSNENPIIAGISGIWSVGGSPAGNLLFNLYDSSHALLASTFPVPASTAKIQTSTWTQQLFNPATISGGASTVTLAGGQTYTVAYADSAGNSDSTSAQYRPYYLAFDSDTNSLALIPWSMQLDQYNGTSWTQTAGQLVPFALLPATGNEFASGGSTTIISPPRRLTIVRGFSPSRDRYIPLPAAPVSSQLVPVLRQRTVVRREIAPRPRFVPLPVATPAAQLLPLPRMRVEIRREHFPCRRTCPIPAPAAQPARVIIVRRPRPVVRREQVRYYRPTVVQQKTELVISRPTLVR